MKWVALQRWAQFKNLSLQKIALGRPSWGAEHWATLGLIFDHYVRVLSFESVLFLLPYFHISTQVTTYTTNFGLVSLSVSLSGLPSPLSFPPFFFYLLSFIFHLLSSLLFFFFYFYLYLYSHIMSLFVFLF